MASTVPLANGVPCRTSSHMSGRRAKLMSMLTKFGYGDAPLPRFSHRRRSLPFRSRFGTHAAKRSFQTPWLSKANGVVVAKTRSLNRCDRIGRGTLQEALPLRLEWVPAVGVYCSTMRASEIRDCFLRYFERHEHAVRPSSSLVPADDP